ncbi:unnamed protein product [Miscanthus lutarioriparius]|uniref:Legume lectin domain-containing protein n=1 Tax=Miscanthus lutarioriparius TaxID=422564 RepID=A0A811N8D8_9POAL|nr:unnamed protein product [Miscanthus lutarioriparius]
MAASRSAAMTMCATTRLVVISLVYLMVGGTSRGALRASCLSFDFDFSNASTFSLADFTTAGAAAFHGQLFDLTANAYRAGLSFSVGRVAYAHPVPLRDKATGQVASFTTAFSFAINITDMNNKGDGMAFFFGHYPSALPPNSEGDYCLNRTVGLSQEDRFVAVEFDTFNDSWDPNVTYDHMGIDVNSIVSVGTITLPSFSLNGQMSARVDYNSSTSVMDVELRFDHSPKFGDATPTFNVSAKVDLGTALPEQVAIGFSAATGSSIELHQLLSWSFSLVHQDQGRTRLVEWVWGLYGRGSVLEAADERMDGEFDHGEMERVMVVGLACAHPDPSLRPSIRHASV